MKFCHIATAAAFAASPALAQDIYVGGTLSFGDLGTHLSGNPTAGVGESDINGFSVLAGLRYGFDGGTGAGMFVGAEAELSRMSGFNVFGLMEDDQTSIQGELHLGYQAAGYALYGFYGIGSKAETSSTWQYASTKTIYGIGAEIDVQENIALRIELEMTEMTVESCSTYDVETSRVSVGAIYKF